MKVMTSLLILCAFTFSTATLCNGPIIDAHVIGYDAPRLGGLSRISYDTLYLVFNLQYMHNRTVDIEMGN